MTDEERLAAIAAIDAALGALARLLPDPVEAARKKFGSVHPLVERICREADEAAPHTSRASDLKWAALTRARGDLLRAGRKPTVPEVLPIVRALYRRHSAGCCWHILLDDRNVGPGSADFCVPYAWVCKEGPECRQLADLIPAMSKTQHRKLGALAHEWPEPPILPPAHLDRGRLQITEFKVNQQPVHQQANVGIAFYRSDGRLSSIQYLPCFQPLGKAVPLRFPSEAIPNLYGYRVVLGDET